jgi:hypothetical protein
MKRRWRNMMEKWRDEKPIWMNEMSEWRNAKTNEGSDENIKECDGSNEAI